MDSIDPSSRRDATPAAQHRDTRFDVFLSHSSRDKGAVERIARALKEAGIEPWFDTWHLTPGGDWQSEMAAGIRASRSCAVFVGAEGIGDWERQELGLALDQAAKDRHFRVFAVLLPGVPEPFDPTHLPPFVSTRTWVDFRGGVKDRKVLQRLINAVVGIPVGAEEGPAARPEVCPYRGLQTFDEEHAEFFFGREADVQRLLERLKERRFLGVLGPSGSGKSSLVRAGLIPALRRGGIPGSDTWRVVVLRPGAEPLTTLAAHLLDLPGAGPMQSTVDLLAEDDRTVHLAVARAHTARGEEEGTLWVVDQLEEVFTLCRDEDQRRAFFGNLLHAAFAPGGMAFVVITMRADFYPKCASYPDLAQGISANQFLAWPMEEWALAEAIEEPARAVGLHLEEGLTDQILSDLREAPGALPLMEHTLLELWERRRGSMMTLEAYREAGGVAGSLAKRADLVYEGLPDPERAIARRVLLRLTQPGEGTEDTRRRAAFDELVGAGEDREPVERVVAALTHARLLTTGTGPRGDGRVVDVSHEALIRGWPRLREWLDEDRTGLRIHRRLTEAAEEWERSGRDPEALYRGVRLAQASEWAGRNPEALNELETTFLRESVEAQEGARRRGQRRARVAVGALVGGLVVVATFALLAFRQSRLANSREIAATSLEQLDRDPQLSLLLAIEAYETAPTAQAEAAVRRALVNSHLRRVLPVEPPFEITFDVSADGRTIATGTIFGEVALWDRASGRRLAVLQPGAKPEEGPPEGGPPEGGPLDEGAPEGPKGAGVVTFSPDGKRLYAVQGADGRIWSVPDGRLVAVLRGGGGFIAGGWTPDGRSILTAIGGVARLWDTATGAVRREVRVKAPRGEAFTFAVLSADGQFAAIQDGERTVRLVRMSTGKTLGVLEGHLMPGRGFSRDGRRLLLVAGPRQGLRVFEVPSGRKVVALRSRLGIYDAAFSPDGERIIAAGEGDTARIWDVRTGKLLLELGGHGSDIPGVSFSPDGKLALTASEDSTARLWDAATGRVLAVFAGHTLPVQFARFTPDGRFVVTAGGGVRIWGVTGGAAAILRGHEGPVVSARFSPDGKSIISSDVFSGNARIWNVVTKRQSSALEPPKPPGTERHLFAEFAADGRGMLTSGFIGEGGIDQEPVRLWDLATGKVLGEFPPPQEGEECRKLPCPAPDAALSPDGTRLAMIEEHGASLRIWDVARTALLKTTRLGEHAEGVEWTPDGRKIIALVEGRIQVIDAITLRRIRKLGPGAEGGGVLLPAVSPRVSADGSLVAVGYADRTARVWEIATGRLVAELPHAAPVSGVAFSPNGRFLVTGSGDAPTIWDLESQRPLLQLFGHRGGVGPVDFSPDGSSIVSGGVDRSVRIWRCEVCAPIDEVLRLARTRVLRELTPAERSRFLGGE
jgi:WD40 repeat protein